jgi:methionyl aminopeptidase
VTRLKSTADLVAIRSSARILRESLDAVRAAVAPGVTTAELDEIAAAIIVERGARAAFLGYMDYPASICVSVNEEIIHGIPGSRTLASGDIVSLDVGVDLDGFFSDAACTVPVGVVGDDLAQLLRTTEECLGLAVAVARPGARVRDLALAVTEHAELSGYGVVRQYCGHGVGFEIHEDPQIPNYPGSGENPRLKVGMVLAVEPMLNLGDWGVDVLADGWTVVTADRRPSAHFEHTIAILDNHTEVLTAG